MQYASNLDNKTPKASIVPGPFACVTSGNGTRSWMLDGDDIQARADTAMSKYWSDCAVVLERGVDGFGLRVDGVDYIVDVYSTLQDAERAMARNTPKDSK